MLRSDKKMASKKEKYQMNQTKSIRFSSKFPKYCLDYLNTNDCGNNDLLELLQIGIDTKLKQSGTSVDISPLFLEMGKEKMEEINQNYLLKRRFVELAEWFLFSEREIPFQHSIGEVDSTSPKEDEDDE